MAAALYLADTGMDRVARYRHAEDEVVVPRPEVVVHPPHRWSAQVQGRHLVSQSSEAHGVLAEGHRHCAVALLHAV